MADDAQTGKRLSVVPLPVELLAELPSTMHDRLFSKPNPSPSGSVADDTHIGKPVSAVPVPLELPVPVVAELPSTIQE